MSDAPLPPSCDVLVVGAGPAGSACAQMLARAGLHTVLVDQHDFPRDKVCGDGLIPDAHAALRRLGVYDEVMAQAQPAQHVACIGPRGGRVDVPGSVAVLPRKVLDHILVRAAQRAGAALHTPWRFEAPLIDGTQVVGARLKGGEQVHEVRAPLGGDGHRRGAAGDDRQRAVPAPHAHRHRAARLRDATTRWSAASARWKSSGTSG